jgi:hypothetical protein
LLLLAVVEVEDGLAVAAVLVDIDRLLLVSLLAAVLLLSLQ